MKKLTIVLLLASSLTAMAGWSGMPIPAGTDYWVGDASYHYMFQLHSALYERAAVTDPPISYQVAVPFSVFVGYTNGIVTNGAYVFTNVCASYISTSVTYKVDETQFVTTVTLDPGGSNWTAKVPLTMGIFDLGYGVLGQNFVSTNFSSGGTFNNYFSWTNSAGTHPTYGPVHFIPNLPIGGIVDPSPSIWYDGGGTSYVENTFAAYYWRRQSSDNSMIHILGELTGTNSGSAFSQLSTGAGAFDATNGIVFPVARVYGTNALAAYSIMVTGSVYYLDGSTWSTYTTQEIVSISSSNTALTVPFWTVTSMTGSLPDRATVAIIYTNDLQYYSAYVINPTPGRLTGSDINDKYDIINMALWRENLYNTAWSNGTRITGAAFGPTLVDAQNIASTNISIDTNTTARPQRYTVLRDYNDGSDNPFYAEWAAVTGTLSIPSSKNTNAVAFTHTMDVYLKIDKSSTFSPIPNTSTFEDYGASWVEGYHQLYAEGILGASTAGTRYFTFGTTNQPPWPGSSPPAGQARTDGWELGGGPPLAHWPMTKWSFDYE